MIHRIPVVVAVLTATALVLPTAAHADSAPLPTGHISEKQLRAFETRLLGAQHAREHAELRRLERREAAKARRHQRWLRSLSPAVRRRVERVERLRRQRANAKKRAYLTKVDASFDPAVSGQWTKAPFPLHTPDGHHVMAINTAVLPTGKVLMYSYPMNPNPTYGGGTSSPNEATAFVWDPSKGYGSSSFQEFAPPNLPETGKPANIWCSGISFNADGTILVTGGNLGYLPDWKGLDTIYTFNPFTERWHYEGRMREGRWYPTQVLLPDGRSVIMSGYDKSGSPAYNNDIEVYDPARPEGQRIYRIATRNNGVAGSSGHPPTGGLYPHNYLMPSGNVLVAGPFVEDSWLFKAGDVPASTDAGLPWTNIADVGTAFAGRTWMGKSSTSGDTEVPNVVGPAGRDQLWGTGVIVPSTDPAQPSTKVMLLGGNYPYTQAPTQTDRAVPWTETFDDANRGAGWQAAPSMNVGRGHANTVILPDGSMVEVGGGYGIVNNNQWLTDGTTQHQVELWNPANGQWTLGPAQVEGRAYHSTAVLLPDGRVLSAGDDWNGSDPSGNPVSGGQYGISDDTAEIYSPPYLFKGARPTIASAPSATPYGGVLSVVTPDTDVVRAALVAPSATTHANDMNQRYVALSVQQRPGGVNLTVPANANVMPPGYYMLFLINTRGVPSVATWVRVGTGLAQGPINSAPPTFAGTATVGSTLTISSLGGWSGDGLAFARQWRRCSSSADGCIDIPGANDSAYTVTPADGGSTIRLRVVASNSSGSVAVDSAPSGTVPGAPGCTGACASDKSAPKLSFHSPKRRKLKALLKSGLTLRVKCSEPCKLSGILDLKVRVRTRSKGKTVTRLRVYVVARSKTATASKAGKVVTVKLRLSSSGKKRLRRVKPRHVRLTLTARDAAGNKRRASRTILVTRR